MEQQFIREWNDLTGKLPARHFILAISGGVDSVVLSRLLANAGASFSLAHCNFKLRGEESDKDEEFVISLAGELGVEVKVKSFETEKYASEKGVSIQMAARDLRYSWFHELLQDEDTYLVTAHHANDVAETMLFNLARGTGLPGLHGIPKFDGRKIRPLLWADKDEIMAYAREHELNWREDRSNTDNKYARNRIRNLVVPELQKINPSFIDAALRTSERVADSEDLLNHLLDQLKLVRQEGNHLFIDKVKLQKLPGKATALYRLLRSYGFSYDQVESVVSSLDSIGATFLSQTHALNVDRIELVLSSLTTAPDKIEIREDSQGFSYDGRKYTCKIFRREDYQLQSDPGIAAFDFHKLKFPLIVRPYEVGERFRPLGMTGKKLVSDFLIDQKVPVNLKKEQAVITSRQEIIWLVGRRIDERFKISTATDTVFEIRAV